MKLTEKQKRFIDYYIQTGNASESCRMAGYRGDNLDVIGAKNLNKLQEYILPRVKELDLYRTADLKEIFEFWTKTMKNEDIKTNERLKASELLAKSQGAFIEKVEVKEIETDWFV